MDITMNLTENVSNHVLKDIDLKMENVKKSNVNPDITGMMRKNVFYALRNPILESATIHADMASF